ncbi:hypothetical protein PMAYCL1PPCAC_19215, partial [Pristionchus mayeri]
MSITAIGTFQNWHYQQLTPTCRIMRCERAGVNVDYFTLLLRVAGLSAVVHPKEVIEDPEYMDMLGNGSLQQGASIVLGDLNPPPQVNFALPITGVTYGYIVKEDRTEIRDLLDKLEWEDYNALIWPYFPLKVYCKDEECVKWNELKSIGAISLPEKNDAYFKQLAEGSKLVGFASIGDELLRGDVVVYNRRDRLLFIADQNLCEQPFSFMISKKRKDLVEVFNRAIAMTSSVYPRMMTRYLSPYGVYSEKIHNMEVSQLTLSNFEPVWQFFAV